MKKRIISFLLAVVLMVTVVPWTAVIASEPASAAENGQQNLANGQPQDNQVHADQVQTDSGDAISGRTGECTWTLYGTELVISGEGPMADYSASATLPWGTTITKVTIGPEVTAIGSYAFRGCTGLTSVEIPDNVQRIGLGAFSGCSGLTSMTIPFVGQTRKNANEADQCPFGYIFGTTSYSGGTKVTQYHYENGPGSSVYTSYYIPQKLTKVTVTDGEILKDAFRNCTMLESVTIPANGTSIGTGAFRDCTNLSEIVMGSNLQAIESSAFYGCKKLVDFVVPEGVRSIGTSAFSGCSGLKSISLPESIEKIGNGAFENCSKLAYNDYQNGRYLGNSGNPYLYLIAVTSTAITEFATHEDTRVIGWYVFAENTNLTSVTIGDKVTHIQTGAFWNCTGLTSVSMGSSVQWIDYIAFSGCTSLVEIDLPDSLMYLAGNAFTDCSRLQYKTYQNAKYLGNDSNPYLVLMEVTYKGITAFNILSGTRLIAGGAFQDCTSLTSIVIPDHVLSIGAGAFTGCEKLQSITVPFVGDRKDAPEADQEIFAHLFGSTSKTGFYSVEYYYTSNTLGCYYVPNTLTSITVTGGEIVPGAFYALESLTSISLPQDATYVGKEAFWGCSKLKSITLPDSVESIGAYAFSGTAITSLTLPSGMTGIEAHAFQNANKLQKIVIPDGVTRIGEAAFYSCSSLKSVTIPDGVKTIGPQAFAYCTSLTVITVPDSVEYMGEGIFSGCSALSGISIPFVGQSRKTAGETGQYPLGYLFGTTSYNDGMKTEQSYYNTSLSSVTTAYYYIPLGLTTVTVTGGDILRGAFQNCAYITTVNLQEGVTEIREFAFSNCTKLQDLTVPNSLENIEYNAFSGCTLSYTVEGNGCYLGNSENPYLVLADVNNTTITSFTIPAQTKILLYNVFYDCTKLTSITIPESVTAIGSSAFYNCTSLTSISIPQGVTTIGSSAFYNCAKLTNVTIPENVTVLNSSVFAYCTSLTSITIPENVTAIGNYAFRNCTSLTGVIIPENVTAIGSSAFLNCTSLTSITVPDRVETIGSTAFGGCRSLRSITIPFVGQSRKTAADTYQYPLGYIFGTTSYTGGTATKQYYYGSSLSSTTYTTYYIPTNLKTVTVTDGNLLYGAFYGCKNLTTISIGEGVEYIVPEAFTGCDGLEAFAVDENNPNYCAVNRILYNKDRTEIIWTPASHTFLFQVNYIYANWEPVFASVTQRKKAGAAYSAEIPEVLGYHTRITSISGTMPAEDLIIDVVYYENDRLTYGDCNDAISWTLYSDGVLILRGTGPMPDYTSGTAPWAANSYDVQLVYMDARITSIGAYAFEGCKNMTFIDYGYSLTHIGAYAFSGCEGLTSFKLPNSVTEIANGAFAGCAGLKNVVIPDNITAVGAEAFRGCSELIQVTVGGNVASIGENAFADCSRLTQVYFRGKPATLGSNAFGRTSGKYIYYYSNVDGWDAAIVDGLWYGYTAVPYNAIAKENFDGTNVYIIKVVDKHNMPLVGAVVDLGGNVQATNADGMVYFLKPEQPQTLTVSCANHITFTDDAFVATTSQVMDIIELSDKPSTVQGVRMNNQSIATSVATLNCAESKTVTITVSGYSKYPIDRYELYQGNRLIATETTSANQCTFRVPAGDFEEGQTVLVRMYTEEGDLVTMVASALNIDVVKMASISKNQVITELSDVNLDITLGEFGDVDFELPFSIHGAENIYVRTEGRTMIVGINLDVNELFDRKLSKKAIQEKIDDYVEDLSGGAKMSVEVKFCGYLEIEYLGNDQYYIKSSYVKMSIGVWAESELRASFYGVVGVYFKLKFGVEGTVEVLIDRFSPEKGFELDQLDFTLKVGVEVEGGVFLLWGAGSAGVFANLTMGFTIGFVPSTEIKSVFVQGDLGIRWQIGWGLLKGEYSIGPKDIYRWPESAAAMMASLYAAKKDPNSYTPNDRGYLADRSQWLFGTGENGSLQENIYEHVAPQLITCGDTTIMVWLDDNSQRDNANFQMLYYSVYSGGSWSEPVAVDDNGTFDCEFDAYTDGEKIYVIYTEMKELLSDAQTLDITDPESITAFVTGVEVNVAVFENGRFGTPVRLTDNDICEQLPEITEVDGVITAAWLESNAIGVETETLGNTVVCAMLGETGWSEPAQFVNGQNTVSGITAVHLQGSDYFAYIVDADGNGETQNDQLLVLRGIYGDAQQLDTGAIANVAYTAIGGTPVLTWYNNGCIYMIADAAQQPVALTPEHISAETDYQIVSLSDGRTLLFFVMKNYDKDGNAVDNTDIYSVYIDCSGCLSSPVRQTKTEGYITSYAVSWKQDKLLAVFTETFAQVGEEDGLETVTHFRSTELEFYTDLAIDALKYDVSQAWPGCELQLQFAVTNQGTDTVDGLTLNFYDALGQLLYTVDCDMTLASGAAAEGTMTIVLPQELSADAYTVEILPKMAEDTEPANNQVELTLAYADLSVSAEQKIIGEKNYILVSVINDGNTASKAILSVYAAEELIAQLETGVIDPGITEQYLVDVDALTSDEDKLLSCVVASEFADPYGLNNTDTVYLLHIQSETFTTDPEQVIRNPQLSCNVAEFDKYVPSDLTVEITAEAESFVGVEGLVLGIDYIYSNGVVTIYSAYLATLTEDTHTLNFVFDFGYEASTIRTLTVHVSDSTPVVLAGSIGIAGEAVVGATVYADLSGLNVSTPNVLYTWTVDGQIVGNQSSYVITGEDLGKTLTLTVTGTDGYTGTFAAETVVTLYQPAAPNAPVISKVESTCLTVVRTEDMEYSLDCITWQDSNVFADLQPNQTYTVYARIKATATSAASESSAGVSVTTLKITMAVPDAPQVESKDHCTVVLVTNPGMEYKIEGGEWTENPVFTGLQPNTTYVFYQRYQETDTVYASEASALAVTTLKLTVATPDAPQLESISSDTVILAAIAGMEYKIEGGEWTQDPVFTGLQPNTTYVFYQRYQETDAAYASEASPGLQVTTLKITVAAPDAPQVESKDHCTVVLVTNPGMEYKIEGGEWTENPVFTGLQPNTTYVFYQRYQETDAAYASEASLGLQVTTLKITVAAPDAPQLESKTRDTIVLVSSPGMEYRIEGGEWTENPVFTGLQPNTTYVFYQRYQETDTAYASEPSAASFTTVGSFEISGTIASGYAANAEVTVKLMQGDVEVASTVTTDQTYSLTVITQEGVYQLVVSKAGHVTATYEIVVTGEDLVQDVTLSLYGDVNGDGWVDVEDAMMILQYEVGLLDDSDLYLTVGDVSGDGWVDVEDAMLILQYEVGLVEQFPAEETSANATTLDFQPAVFAIPQILTP